MRRSWFAVFVLAVAALGFGVACGEENPSAGPRPSPTPTLPPATAPGDGNDVEDMLGRRMQIPAEVTTVVALSGSAAQFATALGFELVGQPSDAPALDGANPSPVGSTLLPDFNAAAALAPDLVLADAAFHRARLRDFDAFPYPVFVIDAASYEGILEGLEVLGEATGRMDAAEQVVGDLEDHVSATRESVSGRPAPSVLVLTGAGREVYAASDETFVGDLVRLLGATNVSGEAPQGAPIAGFGLVEINQVASLAPDVVLIIPSGQGGVAYELLSSAAWADTPAVLNRRIHELSIEEYLRSPGPATLGVAIDGLAALLYP